MTIPKIIGRTVGTTMPRPNWNQTDPNKADYIRNKPDVSVVTANKKDDGIDLTITTFKADGDITQENVNIPIEEYGVFIGTEDTPYQDFYNAFDEGNVCFLKKSLAGGSMMYLASHIGGGVGYFYCADGYGVLHYAIYTNSNTTWTYNTVEKETEVFVASYGVTTYEEVKAAKDAGKVCVLNSYSEQVFPLIRIGASAGAYFSAYDPALKKLTYASLSTDNVWANGNIPMNVKEEVNSTSQHTYIPTAKAVYDFVTEQMKNSGGVSEEDIAAAVEAYLAENPVETPEVDLTGYVKSVNGTAPDENGNVEVEIPEGFSGSWNDLTDKPFVEAGGDTLTWDGDTTGMTPVTIDATVLYKVSDALPTDEELGNATIGAVYNGEVANVKPSDLGGVTSVDGYSSIVNWVFVIRESVAINGVQFNETGIYFYNNGEMYIQSLSIPGYTGFTTLKLDEKYIPDTIARVEDIPEIPEIPQEVFIAHTNNTFAEVYAAVSSGKACFATDNADGGFLLPLESWGVDYVMFSGFVFYGCTYMTVTADGWETGTEDYTKSKAITEASTDGQIPTAKAVYDAMQNVGGGGGATPYYRVATMTTTEEVTELLIALSSDAIAKLNAANAWLLEIAMYVSGSTDSGTALGNLTASTYKTWETNTFFTALQCIPTTGVSYASESHVSALYKKGVSNAVATRYVSKWVKNMALSDATIKIGMSTALTTESLKLVGTINIPVGTVINLYAIGEMEVVEV